MGKQFQIGMYGGKFLPLHKGHKSCIEIASKECDTLFVIIFGNGSEELAAVAKHPYEEYLSISSRWEQLSRVCGELNALGNNVTPAYIDCLKLKKEDGTEDWDAETPYVRKIIGPKLDAVYTSETNYSEYFSSAYPEAIQRIIDPQRKIVSISGTQIREMTQEERKCWLA